MVSVARKILMGLAWLYLFGIAVQFLLAGLMLFGPVDDRADFIDAHEGLGWTVLHLLPILFPILAAVGRVGRNLLIATIVLLVVVLPQPIWAAEFDGELLGALHVFGALVIAALTHHVASRATAIARSEPAATAV